MKTAAFYVLKYTDHLNEVLPENPVLWPLHMSREMRTSPFVMTTHLRRGDIPGVTAHTFEHFDDGWEYWVCNWSDADMTAMNIVPEYEADEAYVGEWPDAWHMSDWIVNAKARAGFEKYAPHAFLFFPVKIVSRTTRMPIGGPRWLCMPRHWIQVAGDQRPAPDCSFDPGRLGALFRKALSCAETNSWLNGLGCFASVGGRYPTFSADMFHKITALGITGLTEKTSPSIILHEFREVVGHDWQSQDRQPD